MAEGNRPVERRHQLRRQALGERIGEGREAVGEKLRRCQHIAQIVIDLGDGEAERSQMLFLVQFAHECALRHRERIFGEPDFIAAPRGLNDARGIFRIAAEFHQARSEAADGAQHHHIDRDGRDKGYDRRNRQRQEEDFNRILQHRVPQRRFVEGDLDIFGAHRRIPDDGQDAAIALGERPKRGFDRFPVAPGAQIIRIIDMLRHV